MIYVLQEVIEKDDDGNLIVKKVSSYNQINSKALRTMRDKKKQLEDENPDKRYRIVKQKVVDRVRYNQDE